MEIEIERIELPADCELQQECRSVEDMVTNFRADITSGIYGETAERVSEMFLNPIAHHIGALQHLIVIPNGILHQMPFAALRFGNGYLVETKTITVLPVGSLIYSLVTDDIGTPSGILALGNPIPIGPAKVLPSAELEVNLLNDYFPGVAPKEILIGASASRDSVVGRDLQGHLLHFAAHAEYGYTAETTRLRLTHGDLNYNDVLALDIKDAPLVVLSACDTGRGELLSGDQVYSLADAFLHAQARSVLFTLWSPIDEPTKELMSRFYFHYSESNIAPEALARAQRDLILDAREPKDWAPFVVSEWSHR